MLLIVTLSSSNSTPSESQHFVQLYERSQQLPKGKQMEFVELVILLIAVLLIWFRPEHEKLAWRLTIVGWLMVVLMYVGHVSTSILGVLNL